MEQQIKARLGAVQKQFQVDDIQNLPRQQLWHLPGHIPLPTLVGPWISMGLTNLIRSYAPPVQDPGVRDTSLKIQV
ncbi:hypothetical protein V6N13_127324 [Hibiscus sabdariffa]